MTLVVPCASAGVAVLEREEDEFAEEKIGVEVGEVLEIVDCVDLMDASGVGVTPAASRSLAPTRSTSHLHLDQQD